MRGAKTALFHYDGQLSTRQLTDSGAQITDSYTYDAFGILISLPGPTTNNYLYTGEQLDTNVGLYYLRSRYFNASQGRFVSRDRVYGLEYDPISIHAYLYASADGVNRIDPSGLFSFTELPAVQAIFNYLLANLTKAVISGFFSVIGTMIANPDATLSEISGSFIAGFITGMALGPLGKILRLRVFGKLSVQMARMSAGAVVGGASGATGNFLGQVIGNIQSDREPFDNIDALSVLKSAFCGALGGCCRWSRTIYREEIGTLYITTYNAGSRGTGIY